METKLQENQLQTVQNDHLQMMPIQQAQTWYNEFVQFSKSILKSDLDYGVIPGTPKPSLYKPGAEKLRFVYGLGVEFECIDKIVDLDRPFVDYSYRCTIKSKTGQILAQCEGNCNSLEAKFGYVWKPINELPEGTDISKLLSKTTGKKLSEFAFAVDKAETQGAYGKPAEYWKMWEDAIMDSRARRITKKTKNGKEMDGWELDESVTVYRLPNPDVVGVKNTIMKMAQKRAFVGGILLATGASEFFTQDIEDMDLNGKIYIDSHDVPFTDVEIVTDAPPAQPKPQQQQQQQPEAVPGHWHAKLERCKTKEDIDNLALKNQETIEANPELKKVFQQYYNALKKQTANAN